MKCFVTGGSGFIGANLVHELGRLGHSVRVLARPGASLRGLEGADYEVVEGDLSDRKLLQGAMRGFDWCFHTAASYHLWQPDYAEMFTTNVNGTRNVLEAAFLADCSRIVYTSTVGCIGLPRVVSGQVIPSDESVIASEAEMTCAYKRSKWQAEAVAHELVKRGLPVVIVNPSAPVGPRDAKPTPTGQLVVDFLRRALPAYVDTGLNWVHVRDVAIGHILAAEKGVVGERYILGHAEGNWTLREAFAELADLTGIPAPKVQLPYFVPLLLAHIGEALAKFTGRPPRAPLAGVRMARHKMFYNPAKAIRELGLPQTPPRTALAEAAEWFRQNDFLR